ncbi:MAG: class I adenylate-forming enzyme family protein [Burkholderiaceae bacterium]
MRPDPPPPAAARWAFAPLPGIRRERHYGDRLVNCFFPRPRSIHALLETAVLRAPDAEAVVAGATRLSYRALEREVGRLSAGLRAMGLRAGDRLMLLCTNRPEFLIALLACQRLALIAVPVSVRERGEALRYMIGQSGALALVIDADLLGRLNEFEAPLPASLRHLVVLPGDAARPGAPLPLTEWPTLFTAASVDTAVDTDEESTAVLLYTSGTTGRPKGAMLTHLGVIHSAEHFRVCMGLEPGLRSILAVPASHVTGLVAILATTLHCAGTVILMDEFKAPAFLALAERERMSYTLLVPAMYKLCLLNDRFGHTDLSHWRSGGFGGAPMPASTIDELALRLPGLRLMNAYGATETTSPATTMPAHLTRDHLDSVGLALPCAEIQVCDDDGRPVPAGTVGELWIRGPMVVPGYWQNPQAGAAEFSDGYWHSGDLGSIDEQGFVRVFDRKKDMINRGGYKIFSIEVENLLLACAGVREAAVIGRPCPVLGERVHAVVSTDADRLDPAALQAYCRERLADYKVPETIRVQREPLPRNANGKVLKRQLRESAG